MKRKLYEKEQITFFKEIMIMLKVIRKIIRELLKHFFLTIQEKYSEFADKVFQLFMARIY